MKQVTFSDEAREKLKKGVDLIADSVQVTLGPRGRNMIYGFHYGYPVCTKDGVTVARQVEAKDPTEQLGLLLIRQVAQKTADDAGDGTTTATILARAIFTEGLYTLRSGANPVLLKRGIDSAVEEVVNIINILKKPILGDQSVTSVAMLSANNDAAIGKVVCEAVNKVGPDGVITIEDNYQGSDTIVETVEGMQLNEGLISPYFITDPIKMEAAYQNAFVIILDCEIGNVGQIKGIVEKAVGSGRAVILVCAQLHNVVLQGLVQSRMKNNIPILVVKAPYFGDYRSEQLLDLAIATGGKVIGYSTGLRPEEVELGDLGQVESLRATRHYTTFVNGRGRKEDIDGRITVIKAMIDKSESDYEKEKLRERLSKLTSGVAVIKVGAPTEVEQKEKKMRVEDALLATKAAIEDGIVPGGGMTLYKIAEGLKDLPNLTEEETIGRRIVKRALKSPFKQIAFNSGIDWSDIAIGFKENAPFEWGYDFLANKYGDLIEMGIVDPAKVVKATVINAASVAGLLLTTEVVCNEIETEEVTKTPKPRAE